MRAVSGAVGERGSREVCGMREAAGSLAEMEAGQRPRLELSRRCLRNFGLVVWGGISCLGVLSAPWF